MYKLNKHFSDLREAYQSVGKRTWLASDFDKTQLEISRSLFNPESLESRNPRPKAQEVYALLSGLPFEEDFTEALISVQKEISKILKDSLHYWVLPQNLGLEYCVFKWPDDYWHDSWQSSIETTLTALKPSVFKFIIGGIQINPDGCVVARGFDKNAEIFRLRTRLKSEISFMPKKQSAWAHVPLGRILEPLGVRRFSDLASLMQELSDITIASTEIRSMKFIHETRWYMEERELIAEYPLIQTSAK
ncbi:hypothetical protein [Thiohalophilus thiocyanatoxydans]|uniref:Uncharacterized protein n=1 Tax=Thiohalophilus thiocyanatoxydans TaxID=381308 RepID=A0A4R8IQ41_9GAMM|nr:hypothetical protein [Thiohalophilus thiocyanatoxydans]TDY02678.1 hypothetical protein EDC23_1054 [Thiohalophilus thiocyanatoxydans]